MRTLDFSPLFRSTVGFDRLFDLMDSYAEQSSGYPPYNIERSDETHYRITLAVAGFGEKDLSIEVKEGVLTVTGERTEQEKADQSNFLYQGIAGRSFERRFQVADYVKVTGAKLENGLLQVDLVRELPEALRPRKIAITTGKGQHRLEAKAA